MGEKLENWILKPLNGVKSVIILFLLMFLFKLIWTEAVLDAFNSLDLFPKAYPTPASVLKILLFGCVFAPLVEELLYRVGPIQAAKRLNPKLIVPTIIVVSIIFGQDHTHITGSPQFHVMVQGLCGVLYSILYIKSNYSYLTVVGAHSLWNIYAYFGHYLFR